MAFFFFFFFLRGGNLRKSPGAIEGWPRVVPDSYRLKLPLWPSASCGLGAPVPPARFGAPQLSSIVGGNPSSSLPSLVDSSQWGHARRRPFPWSASGSADPHPFAPVPVLPCFPSSLFSWSVSITVGFVGVCLGSFPSSFLLGRG